MTGRDKIRAAFSMEGASHIGAVVSYDTLLIRDQWKELTRVPWWYRGSGLVDEEVTWSRDFITATGIDWLKINSCPSRRQREVWSYEVRGDGVWRVDRAKGEETKLTAPAPGGTLTQDKHGDPDSLPTTPEQFDAMIPLLPQFDEPTFRADGRDDVAQALTRELDVMLYSGVSSPLWSLYALLGYEAAMVLYAEAPQLVAHAGRRFLGNVKQRVREQAALGVDALWIEECMTDQISPRLFWSLNVPLISECVSEMRRCGVKSIYYYCGNPNDRLDAILACGADAVHFEESKKGFAIDIQKMAEATAGRCALFGNLDAIGLLQDGTDDDLRVEINRQLRAARSCGNRFVLSTGSPVTPQTPIPRVRRYTDIVRQLS